MGKACDREALAEGVGQVGKVDFGRVEGVVLDCPVADGLEVAVAELGEGDFRRSRIPRSASAGLPSWLEEGHDVHAGRQGQQPLLEQPQEIFVAGLHALGFGLLDLADGHEMLQSTIAEDDAPRAAAELEGGHGLPLSDGNASPMSPRSCCQIVASRFVALSYLTGMFWL